VVVIAPEVFLALPIMFADSIKSDHPLIYAAGA
jgi:hypothetical protein